jgi:hypothetical protein
MLAGWLIENPQQESDEQSPPDASPAQSDTNQEDHNNEQDTLRPLFDFDGDGYANAFIDEPNNLSVLDGAESQAGCSRYFRI